MREPATRRPLRGLASGIVLCLAMAATDLVAAPNDAAPPAASKDSAAPAMIAGTRLGRMIRRKMVNRFAPSEAAASSTSASSSSSTPM